MVSKNNSDCINGKVGDTIHDGWSSDVIRYLELFASYELEKGNNVPEVETNCLSISPLNFFQMIVMMMMRQMSW